MASARTPQRFNVYRDWFDVGNAKARKGFGKGYLTAVHYMAPAKSAGGESVCPWAQRCVKPCLAWGGRGLAPSVRKGRVERTRLFLSDPAAYCDRHVRAVVGGDARGHSIQSSVVQVAHRHGLIPAVRLNGTSDISYEEPGLNVFARLPGVICYDYTKGHERMLDWLRNRGNFSGLRNYHLTFSLGGSLDTSRDAEDVYREILDRGGNVAAVWEHEEQIPWGGVDRFALVDDKGHVWKEIPLGRKRKVIDGNVSDLRFLDPRGVVVALYARKFGIGGGTRALDTGTRRFFLKNPSARRSSIAYVTGLPMAALEPR